MLRIPVAALGLALALAGPAAAQQTYGTSSGSSQDYGRAAQGGHSVADVQRALSRAGYDPGPADGIIGPGTRRAIASFQADMGLPATGETDGATLAALERRGLLAAAPSQPSWGGSSGQQTAQWPRESATTSTQTSWTGTPREVVDLQRALTDAGYYRGPLHGTLDGSTRYAVANLQQDLGQEATGQPGPAVIEALRERGFLTAQAPPAPQTQQQRPRAQGPADPSPQVVADVQAALSRRGYDIPKVNGRLDAETRAAVRSFQRSQGLPATGRPSPELLALIETGGQAPAQMSDAEVIREIQVRLHNRGHAVGAIDGSMNRQTADAIAAYQRHRGMQATGEPSRQLLADLQQTADAQEQAQTPAPSQGQPRDLFGILGQQAIEGLTGSGGQGGQD